MDVLREAQDSFTRKLGDFERYALYRMRRIMTQESADELLPDVVALGWKCWLAHWQKHLYAPVRFEKFVRERVFHAIRGERVQGAIPARDVMSGRYSTARKEGFGPREPLQLVPLDRIAFCMEDRKAESPPDRVCARTLFAQFEAALSPLEREMMLLFLAGHNQKSVARLTGHDKQTVQRWRRDMLALWPDRESRDQVRAALARHGVRRASR